MDIYFNVYSDDTLDGYSLKQWKKFGYGELLKVAAFLGIPIISESEERLKKYFEYREFEKGDILVPIGGFSDIIAFIIDGAAVVSYGEGEDECIVNLCGPGSLVTSVENLYYGRPSNVNIRIIKKTRALVITKEDLPRLLELPGRPHLKEEVFNKINFLSLTFHKQISTFLALDNAHKVDKAMELFPTMFQHFPLKIIAKFLGMEPESMSRLRSNENKNRNKGKSQEAKAP